MRDLRRLTEEEIARRLPVWMAFSDSFLDTWFDESHYLAIGVMLAESGFPKEELAVIFREEVAPRFVGNLYDVAGVWDGWTEDSVLSIMLERPLTIGGKIASIAAFSDYIDREWDRISKAIPQ